MEEKLKEYLKVLEFEENDIQEILQLVSSEIDIKSLHEKLKFLVSKGLDKTSLKIIIDENLLFLTSNIKTIEKNMEILEKYLSQNEILMSLGLTPELITLQEENLQSNINMLKIIFGSDDEVKEIIINYGEILLYNTKYLEKRFEYFIKNGLKDQIKNYIIEDIELFDLEEDEIDLEDLKKNLQ